jgi:type I restriction enzyme S subunit
MNTLNDICEVITCGVAKRPEYVSEGVPFLSSKNVKADRFILNDYNFITKEEYSQLTKHNKPQKNDILYTRVGSFGEAAVVDFDFDFAIFVSLTLIKPKSNIVIPRYLMHYLNSPKIKKLADSSTSGIGVQNLNVNVVRKFPIDLPPLDQQKKIASILDAADAYRQKTKALLAKYDELTQSLFLDMFGDPVKNEKGWELKTIEEITSKQKNSIKRGPFGGALKKEIFVEDGFLVYEQFHALNNDFTKERYFINEEKFKELIGFEVKPRDIIISCSGVYLGKLAIVPENAKRGIINQALLKITLDEEIMKNDFFVFLFRHKNFREKYFDANRGAGIPNFPPMSDFKRFPFISPSLLLQNQFVERVKIIEQQKASAQASYEKAEELFNSLLQKAFNGELV